MIDNYQREYDRLYRAYSYGNLTYDELAVELAALRAQRAGD